MRTKLTLRMDEELIADIKQIAKENGKSVSQMVTDYFRQFKKNPEPVKKLLSRPLPPLTSGILSTLGEPNHPTPFEDEKRLSEDLRVANFQQNLSNTFETR